ncbi:alpha/beta hydrolase [Halomarina rubra]|uniref:Alpha/beta hydrolase n=1 Tax=Halomarina rubra TaxID=2071873 RepID=A0ABD6AUB5_9EURY|nr:alpha/beta hydrolase [Halomarina rubra]
MHIERFGDGDRDLLLVLGWGNRLGHPTVRWLVEQGVEAGYRVHGFQIPTVVTDFERDWVRPVATTVDALDEYRLLTHSTGGLIGEFLNGATETVHCSPWWGFHGDLETPLVEWAMKLPVSTPLLPSAFGREELGTLVTDERLADGPKRAAPTFLREARRAQRRLPAFDDETTSVFYTPTDAVVSATAIEERTPARNRVAFEGGHELFSSPSRETHVGTVFDALAEGPSALW